MLLFRGNWPQASTKGPRPQLRWQAVNAAERGELASTPLSDKFRQVAALLLSGQKLGWTEALADEENLVRERWVRLRRKYHA